MNKNELLPENWEKIKLKELSTIVRGGSPRPKGDPKYFSSNPTDIHWIKISDLTKYKIDKHISNTSEYLTVAGKGKSRFLTKGSFVVTNSGTIGIPAFLGINGCIHDGYLAILDIDEKLLDKNYLYYYFFVIKQHLKDIAPTGIQPNLNTQIAKNIEIILPPLETQKKIVEILEKAEKLKKWRVTSDKLTNDYLENVFLEMFGDPLKNPYKWDNDKLENVCIKITDGTHHSPPNSENGDYLYITAKNIKKNGIDLDNITYITKEIHDEIYSRCDPKFGDVLYIKDGVTTGIAVVNDLDFEFSLLSSVALLKMGKRLNPYYLSHLLNSNNMYNRIRYDMGGAAITRLTLVKIKRIKIPIPPIKLQNQFADIVKQVETLKSYQSESKQQIDNLFNTLMQKAFKGELLC